MKKILYYFAQVMLLFTSIMLGFIDSTQSMIICYSCLLTGIFLMLAYAIGTKKNWTGFFLFSSVAMCHLFYLSVSTPYSGWLMGALVSIMLIALFFLFQTSKSNFNLRELLSYTLFAKVALIPEIVLNYLMAKDPAYSMMGSFNWILLAFTSLFAITVLVRMYQKQIIVQNWAIVLGLFQFFFFTDIISCIAALTLIIRYKEPEPVKKKSIYEKASFSNAKARKPKRK